MKIPKYNVTVAFLGLAFANFLNGEESFLSEDDLFNEDINELVSVYDPLESINRYTFKFNDFVYIKVLDPIANGYTFITPDPIEERAKNFFSNLRYPVRLSGNLLQGRWKGAWVETKRFTVNTIIGIAGVFCPANKIEGMVPIPREDIGQALGSWRIGEGPYLVIPLLGPSNVRDLFGLVGDATVQPTREPLSLISDWNWEWRTALAGTEYLDSSPTIMDSYIRMKGNSIDAYSSLKNGYTQYRRAAVEQ